MQCSSVTNALQNNAIAIIALIMAMHRLKVNHLQSHVTVVVKLAILLVIVVYSYLCSKIMLRKLITQKTELGAVY